MDQTTKNWIDELNQRVVCLNKELEKEKAFNESQGSKINDLLSENHQLKKELECYQKNKTI